VFYRKAILIIRARCAKRHILIYSQTKVGTESLLLSLKKTCPGDWIFKAHYLKDRLEYNPAVFERYFRVGNGGTIGFIYQNYALHQYYKSRSSYDGLRILSGVRDPIAKEVAGFFNELRTETNISLGELKGRSVDEQTELLLAAFLKRLTVRKDWFLSEMQPFTGIDVYKTTFDKEKGYQIIEGDHHPPLLVFKLEKLKEIAHDAIGKFLGISNFKPILSNAASQKWYREIYKRFLERVAFPRNYLDEVYGSRTATHFYTDEEISSFRKRWSGG